MASSTQVGSTTFTRPNDTQLVAMRLISAPPDFVWEAHTLCEQVKQWLLGPDGWTMPVCEIDLRPGGKYRYVYEATDGRTFQMSGEYQEIEGPDGQYADAHRERRPHRPANGGGLPVEGGPGGDHLHGHVGRLEQELRPSGEVPAGRVTAPARTSAPSSEGPDPGRRPRW
jgi:hypothetical protein